MEALLQIAKVARKCGKFSIGMVDYTEPPLAKRLRAISGPVLPSLSDGLSLALPPPS
jgi:hypothetical protein